MSELAVTNCDVQRTPNLSLFAYTSLCIVSMRRGYCSFSWWWKHQNLIFPYDAPRFFIFPNFSCTSRHANAFRSAPAPPQVSRLHPAVFCPFFATTALPISRLSSLIFLSNTFCSIRRAEFFACIHLQINANLATGGEEKKTRARGKEKFLGDYMANLWSPSGRIRERKSCVLRARSHGPTLFTSNFFPPRSSRYFSPPAPLLFFCCAPRALLRLLVFCINKRRTIFFARFIRREMHL